MEIGGLRGEGPVFEEILDRDLRFTSIAIASLNLRKPEVPIRRNEASWLYDRILTWLNIEVIRTALLVFIYSIFSIIKRFPSKI